MATILNVTYGKKLGLPNYSSHQCAINIQVEIASIDRVHKTAKRLYALAQGVVDRELKRVGFLPEPGSYGVSEPRLNEPRTFKQPSASASRRTAKQWKLIQEIANQGGVGQDELTNLAKERFDSTLECLSRLQASALINELYEITMIGRGNGHHCEDIQAKDGAAAE